MARYTGMERAEAGRLQEAVKQLETALAFNAATSGSTSTMLLVQWLDSAKKRIAELEELEETAVADERRKSVEDLAIAYKVHRETALSAEERQQYQEFLGREFFTKEDFGKLEKFYEGAWDRLSEDGKAEMSHRVWEGVRRKEYEFSELPDIVKMKEAERLHGMFQKSEKMPENLKRIPESDRKDFIREWESGNRSEAYKVLDRTAFADNVAVTAKTSPSFTVEKSVTREAVQAESKEPAASVKTTGNAAGNAELALDDVLLVNADPATIAAPLANDGKTGGKGKSH